MTARILVVDDVPANLRLLEARLRAEYFEVALASSGAEALALVPVWSPDVVLLDVMMPGMDGFEVCRRLKAKPGTAHVPVVMVTALTDQSERVRGLEAGADDFVSKPVDTALLFARLKALLRVKQVVDAWRLRAETARDLGIEEPEPPSDAVSARILLAGGLAPEADAVASALAADAVAVDHAPDETSAWARLQDEWFDLVLISVPIAGGDALRLASRLRARAESRDIPLVFLAGDDQRRTVLRGFDLGGNDHVMRPVDPPELRARVRNQLRQRRYQTLLRDNLDRSIELAVTDTLTGLRNRRYVRRHLEQLLRAGTPAAVLLIDADRFKPLNDVHGHAAGDAALKELAHRLKQHLRAMDIVGRYGGEEFLAVISGAGAEEAEVVAERLRKTVAECPFELAELGLTLDVTVSIGIAVTRPGSDLDALIADADAALYRAKHGGRNRIALSPDPHGGAITERAGA